MKAVLISIKPKWCELIASGKKTIEVRKTRPKIETPFKCYIYCTKGRREALNRWKGEWFYDTQFPDERPNRANCKVIGEFVCDSISAYDMEGLEFYNMKELLLKLSCLTEKELYDFVGEKEFYGWHISELKIYDNPKELGEFRGLCKYDDRDCWLCSYYDYSNMECKGRTVKSPQSWCYVEELNL